MLQTVAHTLRFPKTCCRKSSTASVCSWQEMQLLASRDLRDLRNVSTSGRVVWHRWYQDNKYHGKQARIWMYMTCRLVQNRGRYMAIHGSFSLHSSMQAELHSLTYWTASNGSNAELKLHTHTFVASIRVSISVRTRVCELLCNGAPRPFEPSDFCSYFGTWDILSKGEGLSNELYQFYCDS